MPSSASSHGNLGAVVFLVPTATSLSNQQAPKVGAASPPNRCLHSPSLEAPCLHGPPRKAASGSTGSAPGRPSGWEFAPNGP